MISDVHVGYKKLKHLEPLLYKWISLNAKYCKTFSDDCLYWYNERATLSSLAAAVWKCNEYALEEYRTDKIYGREYWPGRADLWFSWKRTTYLAEAKQVYASLSTKAKKSSEKIRKALKQAKMDAAASRGESDNRLGIVFAIPYIPPSEIKKTATRIEIFLDEINSIEHDLMAYYLLDKSSMLTTANGYAYPGVVLVARVTKRK